MVGGICFEIMIPRKKPKNYNGLNQSKFFMKNECLIERNDNIFLSDSMYLHLTSQSNQKRPYIAFGLANIELSSKGFSNQAISTKVKKQICKYVRMLLRKLFQPVLV